MQKLYIHPLPVRIWHWLNALGFVLLILSGLQIRYLGVFDVLSFETAVVMHNWVGFGLIANYFLWLGFYLFTDKITVYHPELDPMTYFRGAYKQIKFYAFGIFIGDPNPHHPTPNHKFNGLQSMMYQVIMLVLVPILFVTGLMLWDVTLFSTMINLLGGVRIVATLHVILFIFFSSFIITHVYLVTLGHTPLAHIKAMLTGYEEIEGEPKKEGHS